MKNRNRLSRLVNKNKATYEPEVPHKEDIVLIQVDVKKVQTRSERLPASSSQASLVSLASTKTTVGSISDSISPSVSQSKEIRFDETRNTHHEHPIEDRQVIRQLWWTGAQIIQMKEAYVAAARLADRQASSVSGAYILALERLYQSCHAPKDGTNNNTTTTTKNNKNENAKRKTPIQWSRLQAWSCESTGLEYKLLRTAWRDKQQRRACLLQLLQNFPKQEGASLDEVTLQMARECQNISRPAKVFAMQLAKVKPNQVLTDPAVTTTTPAPPSSGCEV